MYSEDTLLRLIERIYDAALAPESWPEFLDGLAGVTDGHCVNLMFIETMRPGSSLNTVVRFDPEGIRLYNEHYSALDPWREAVSSRGLFRTAAVGLGRSLIDSKKVAETEFYNDFGRRFGVGGGVTAIIRAEPPVSALLNVSERPHGQEFGENEVLLLRRLLPHLQRSLQVHERLATVAAARSAGEEVLDRLPFGVVLVDASGRAVLVNHAAQQILDARDGLTLHDRNLVAANVAQTTELGNLIAGAIAASQRDSQRAPGGPLAVGRPSLRTPLQVLVTPVRSSEASFGLTLTRAPRAAVFVTDPANGTVAADQVLRVCFQLTPSETLVVRELLQGRNVKEAASELQLTENTVRSYLKAILAKTGCRSQSDLVAHLLRSVAALRSREPEGR